MLWFQRVMLVTFVNHFWMEDKVFSNYLHTLDELKAFTENCIWGQWSENNDNLFKGLELCTRAEGRYFEHLLWRWVFNNLFTFTRSWDSSEAIFFSLASVQTRSEAHPASYLMGTGGPYPGDKPRPWSDAGHSPPSSDKVKNKWELCLISPLAPVP
jgi:hypothetical protein